MSRATNSQRAVTDRLEAYGSGGWGGYAPRDVIDEAQRYATAGCRHIR